MTISKSALIAVSLFLLLLLAPPLLAQTAKNKQDNDSSWAKVTEDDRSIKIETDKLEAVIPKNHPKQWMTGIEKHSFVDKATGFHEAGDGLMVIDWLMEPGSDADWPNSILGKDGNGLSRYRWYENETDPAARHYAVMD